MDLPYPFNLVDQARYNATLALCRASRDHAQQTYSDTDRQITALCTEARAGGSNGKRVDIDKITSISGDTAAKVAGIVRVTSDHAAAKDALASFGGIDVARHGAAAVDRYIAADERAALASIHGMSGRPSSPDSLGSQVMAALGGPGGWDALDWGHLESAQTTASVNIANPVGAVFQTGDPLGAVFQTTDGMPPNVRRSGVIVPAQRAQYQTPDLFGIPVPTTQNAHKYLQETITDAAASERAEGADVAEADISTAEVTASIRSIAAYLPVTDEQLADEPTARAYIDERLTYLARRRLARQLVAGDDVGANLQGALNAAQGTVARTTKDGDAGHIGAHPIDVVHKAIDNAAQSGETDPTGIMMAWSAWSAIRGLKTTTDEYLLDPFSTAPRVLDGLPVAVVPDAWFGYSNARNKPFAVAGDFINSADLVVRQDARIDVGYIADDFKKVRRSIRVTLRVAAAWYTRMAFAIARTADVA